MKLLKLKSGLYKRILGIFGAAGFLVTFQACYGTPQNYINIDGSVLDNETNEGLAGMKVNVSSGDSFAVDTTDENGNFHVFLISDGEINLTVVDIDGEQNGAFADFDTTLSENDHLLELKLAKE